MSSPGPPLEMIPELLDRACWRSSSRKTPTTMRRSARSRQASALRRDSSYLRGENSLSPHDANKVERAAKSLCTKQSRDADPSVFERIVRVYFTIRLRPDSAQLGFADRDVTYWRRPPSWPGSPC